MTLILSGDIRLAQGYTRPDDADAVAYIAAVEAADGQPLETEVRMAINAFVKGCKADGIWDAVKASCILAGARTLNGALVPLVGTAPTNFNFVAGDYNRKTGLVGDGSTKYLDSNRSNNVEPQDSRHAVVFSTSADTTRDYGRYLAAGDTSQGDTNIVGGSSPSVLFINYASLSSNFASNIPDTTIGFLGVNRSSLSSWVARGAQVNISVSFVARTPRSENYRIFGRPEDSRARFVNARIAFYSIGESLDLALLDARVTDLINKFAEVIP